MHDAESAGTHLYYFLDVRTGWAITGQIGCNRLAEKPKPNRLVFGFSIIFLGIFEIGSFEWHIAVTDQLSVSIIF